MRDIVRTGFLQRGSRDERVSLADGLPLLVNWIGQTELPHKIDELPAVTDGMLVGVVRLPWAVIVEIPGDEILLDRGNIDTVPVLGNDTGISGPGGSLFR